nr:lysosomal Pro-X carboxypeptidase-like [Ipomoea batatas]
MYYQSATFDMPPTDMICRAINGGSKGIDVLSRIFSGIVAVEGKSSCYLNESKLLHNEDDTDLGLGWQDMKLVLKRFGSNIIFTSGLRDPWSTGGILEDISHSIVAIVTKKGAHASDVLKARKTDPEWLVKQRNKSLKIIEGWITKYYDDLRALNLK